MNTSVLLIFARSVAKQWRRKMNKVLERVAESKCPLCAKDLTEDSKIVDYQGVKVLICNKHPVPGDKK